MYLKTSNPLCRRLVDHLTAPEIQLLRTHPITFVGPNNKTIGGKHPTITGPESDPVVNLFDLGFKGVLSCKLVISLEIPLKH